MEIRAITRVNSYSPSVTALGVTQRLAAGVKPDRGGTVVLPSDSSTAIIVYNQPELQTRKSFTNRDLLQQLSSADTLEDDSTLQALLNLAEDEYAGGYFGIIDLYA